MIYEIETPDGRIIEVQGESGQEELAVRTVKQYLAKEAGGKVLNETQFDYKTGISNLRLRSQLDMAETQEEKESVLKKYVGSRGFIYDANGRLAITPLGQKRLNEKPSNKNIIVDEEGMSAGDFADFAGTVGPVAGAIVALSPGGKLLKALKPFLVNDRLTRASAVAIGSAGGKGVEEASELLLGVQEQQASEIAKDLAIEGVIGGVSQGIFEVGGVAFQAMLGKKPSAIGDISIARAIAQGADPNEVELLARRLGREPTFKDIKKAQSDGIINTFTEAAVSQRAIGRKLAGTTQAASETVFGRTGRDKRLIEYGTQRLEKFLERQGDVTLSLDDFSQAIQTGRLTKGEIDALIDGLSQSAKKSNQALDDYINNAIKLIDDGALTGGADRIQASQNLRNQIVKLYNEKFGYIDGDRTKPGEFVKRSQEIDNFLNANGLQAWQGNVGLRVDDLLGFLERLTTEKPGLKLLQAIEGVQGGSIDTIKGILRDFKKDGISLEALNQLRGTFLTIGRSAGTGAKDVARAVKEITEQVDDIFLKLEKGVGVDEMIARYTKPKTGPLDPNQKTIDAEALQSAAKMIRQYNREYRQAVEPFNNVIVTDIRKFARSGAYDVDEIFQKIIKKNQPNVLKGVLDAIPNQAAKQATKKELQETFVREALEHPNVINIETGQINPTAFARFFRDKLGSTQKILFDDIPDLPRILSDFNKINRNFKPERLEKVLDNLKDKGLKNSLDDFIKSENALHTAEVDQLFKRIRSAEDDEIINLVFKNGQASNIEKLKKVLDPDTFKKIQQDSMRDLLKIAIGPGKRVDEIFNPEILERALNSKGDDALRAMFGRTETKALRDLVRDIRVMTASEGGGAGSLIAGAVAVNAFNFAMFPTLIKLGILGNIMGRPSVVRRLAKADKESINIVMQAFKDAIRLVPPITLGEEVVETTDKTKEFIKNQAQDEIEKNNINLGEEAEKLNKELRTLLNKQSSNLQLPELNINPNPSKTSTTISKSLLGGSPANEDIARSLDRLV
tara:strand:- start:4645 stop:7701 length:3057 start_codon:yes stop_codon:yes gene_type:complete